LFKAEENEIFSIENKTTGNLRFCQILTLTQNLIMDGKGAADAMAKKGSAEEAAHFKKVEAEQLAKIKAQKEAADKEKK